MQSHCCEAPGCGSVQALGRRRFMSATQSSARISVKNILFLTDFSDPSETALPLAFATAREYGATVHALHVLVPQAYMYTAPDATVAAIEAQEENAQAGMQRVESQL